MLGRISFQGKKRKDVKRRMSKVDKAESHITEKSRAGEWTQKGPDWHAH